MIYDKDGGCICCESIFNVLHFAEVKPKPKPKPKHV